VRLGRRFGVRAQARAFARCEDDGVQASVPLEEKPSARRHGFSGGRLSPRVGGRTPDVATPFRSKQSDPIADTVGDSDPPEKGRPARRDNVPASRVPISVEAGAGETARFGGNE
jgi:hypothetical protein